MCQHLPCWLCVRECEPRRPVSDFIMQLCRLRDYIQTWYFSGQAENLISMALMTCLWNWTSCYFCLVPAHTTFHFKCLFDIHAIVLCSLKKVYMIFFPNALCIFSSLTDMGSIHFYQEPFLFYGERISIFASKSGRLLSPFFTLKTLSHIQMNTFNFSPKGTSSVDLAEHLVTWVSPKESKSVGEFRDNFRHFMHWRIKLGGNQAWFSCADLINGQSSEESLSSIRVKARQDGHSHATYILSNIHQRLHLFESFN